MSADASSAAPPPPPKTCSRCGATARGPDGLCRRCLARAAFGAEPPPAPWIDEGLPGSDAGAQRFADYEILEELARGGMGVVYRARQASLGRDVALKILRDSAINDGTGADRFRAEAAAAASLQHPNIVAIHGFGEHDGQPFYAMELIHGQDLAVLTRDGPLSAPRSARLVATVARAIQHAHERGILHRDLKPSNVLVDAADEPHVTDFGLARRMDAPNHLTLTGQVLGTPGYMAPEQAFGRARDVTTAVDIYALGALLFHLLSGRAPFVAESPTRVLQQLERNDPVSLRVLNPSLPLDLETIALKALAKEPGRRYASALALAEELERFLRDEPILARPLGWSGRTWRWCRRRPALAALATLGVLFLVTVVVGTLVSNRRLDAQRRAAEQVKGFLQDILASADPSQDGREVRVVQLLQRAAQRAARELADQPRVRAEIETTLGNTYYQLSLYDEAEPLLRSALALFTQELGPDHWQTATTRGTLGAMLGWAGKYAEGIEELQRAVRALRRVSPAHDLQLASHLEDLGSSQVSAGQYLAAVASLRESVALCQRLGAPAESTLVAAYGDLATALGYDPATVEEARHWQREAIALNRSLPGGKINLATGLSNLAEELMLANQLPEAEAAAQEALALRLQLFGTNSTPTAYAHARLAMVLRARTNLVPAAREAARAVQLQRALLPAQHRDLFFGLRVQGSIYFDSGRWAEAEACFRESREICRVVFGAEHRSTRSLDGCLAEVLAARGDTRSAAPLAAASLPDLREMARMYPGNPLLQARVARLASLAQSTNGVAPVTSGSRPVE